MLSHGYYKAPVSEAFVAVVFHDTCSYPLLSRLLIFCSENAISDYRPFFFCFSAGLVYVYDLTVFSGLSNWEIMLLLDCTICRAEE